MNIYLRYSMNLKIYLRSLYSIYYTAIWLTLLKHGFVFWFNLGKQSTPWQYKLLKIIYLCHWRGFTSKIYDFHYFLLAPLSISVFHWLNQDFNEHFNLIRLYLKLNIEIIFSKSLHFSTTQKLIEQIPNVKLH